MKYINLFLTATVIVLSTACSSELDRKKDELATKKNAIATLKTEITELEKEIAKLDTTQIVIKPKLVSVQTINPTSFQHQLEIQGRVEADQNILLSSKASGTLVKVYVKAGQKVRRGAVLAQVEDDMIRKAIAELNANISLAKTAYDKQKALWEQNIGTEMQYLQSKTQYESLLSRLAQLNEQKDMAKITAPFDGSIDDVITNEGSLVGPGTPVFRLVNTSQLAISAEVAESYANKIKKGDKVTLYFPDLDLTQESYITKIGDVINEVNRSFNIEVALKGNIKNVKANMISYITIKDYNNPTAITAPINTIQHSDQGDYVYIADGKKAKKVIVKSGYSYKAYTEIVEGIKAGDKLITVGYQDLVDGQAIQY